MSKLEDESGSPQQKKKPTVWQLVKTTLCAAIGVQTDANRELDFSQSSPLPYIIMGIVFTIVFLGTLIAIASSIVD